MCEVADAGDVECSVPVTGGLRFESTSSHCIKTLGTPMTVRKAMGNHLTHLVLLGGTTANGPAFGQSLTLSHICYLLFM